MLQIGSQKINTNIILASLAGCTDLSFRLIAREQGAQFCFYEMADSNSLVWTARRKTENILLSHPQDFPIAAQLLGSDPEIMLKAAKKLLEINNKITFLDINAACPKRKVIAKKSGAYLFKESEALYRIIDKLSSSLALPITVKLRIGYADKDVEGAVLIAKKCEQSGAQALFVHGRTKVQEHSGEIDYASIKAIKESVKIPIVASGNILSPQKAMQMLDLTHCDGILVARGALGNPWIFKQIKYYLEKWSLLPDPTLSEKLSVLIKHVQYVEKYKDILSKGKLGFARKIALWYLKSFPKAAILREEVSHVSSFEELYKFLDNINSMNSRFAML